jgi:hypothetical protein
MRLLEDSEGSTECSSDGNMAMRSRAASRPCHKSNMGFLSTSLVGDGRVESRMLSGSGLMVTRRLLKRFSGRQGMEGHNGVLWRVTAGRGLRVKVVCRCYIKLGETQQDVQACELQCTETSGGPEALAQRCRKRLPSMVVRLVRTFEEVVSARRRSRKCSGDWRAVDAR